MQVLLMLDVYAAAFLKPLGLGTVTHTPVRPAQTWVTVQVQSTLDYQAAAFQQTFGALHSSQHMPEFVV